ncbi:SCO family protein [Pseudothauera rhizosphaerae]|uniref:SCO family protein n=1 Tax=Pseudothauera rhizosphaerae TaxID=2565932 RepID=A0A4S4AMK0_9RHOO|nr:SCO family protein [Pseudothauera rhizosphaerae]THF60842.1 SCO family protein [Pseudothauera rhizosphaerae]
MFATNRASCWRQLFAAACAALLLGACTNEPMFTATDITGATFGQDFRLFDPDGRTRSLADFRGKAVLVFFGFTQCPDVCPTALIRAAEVKRLLGADAGRLQVVFVTLDPERDTPAVLREYTAAFGADVLGLYTTVENTARVAEEFRIFYRKVPTGDSYTMDHTATSYVYDPAGRLRLAVLHAQGAEALAADLKTLLQSFSR